MDTHKNAPMTPAGRLRMVQAVHAGESISAVARRLQVDRKTVRKWIARHTRSGMSGLQDRSSRPQRAPRRALTSGALTHGDRFQGRPLRVEVGLKEASGR